MTGRWVVGVFASLLVAVAVLGFLSPGDRGTTSTAPAYNVFHLVFGLLGLALAVWGGPSSAKAFLLGFGVIDLYQALASHQHWFPQPLFRWTSADDLLHVVFGAVLVVVGVLV